MPVGLQGVAVCAAGTDVERLYPKRVDGAHFVGRCDELTAHQPVVERGGGAPRTARAIGTDSLYGQIVSAFGPASGVERLVGAAACMTFAGRPPAAVGIGLRPYDVTAARCGADAHLVGQAGRSGGGLPFHAQQSGGCVHGVSRGGGGGDGGCCGLFRREEGIVYVVVRDELVQAVVAVQVGHERVFRVGGPVTVGQQPPLRQVEVAVPADEVEVVRESPLSVRLFLYGGQHGCAVRMNDLMEGIFALQSLLRCLERAVALIAEKDKEGVGGLPGLVDGEQDVLCSVVIQVADVHACQVVVAGQPLCGVARCGTAHQADVARLAVEENVVRDAVAVYLTGFDGGSHRGGVVSPVRQ